MSEFTNPAKRILSFIQAAASKSGDTSACMAWAEAFGLDPTVADKDSHEVMSKLGILRSEVDLLDAAMRDTDFSESLYKAYIDRVRRTVTVTNIGAPWKSYQGNIGPETVLALRWCAEVLPSEPVINMEELEKLLEEISKLRANIENSSITDAMRAFINSQIDIIEHAIRDYPIIGGEAIKRAFKDGLTDISDHVDVLQGEDDPEYTSAVGRLWTHLKSVGEGVVETDRIATALVRLYEKGGTLFQHVQAFLEHQ